MEIQYSQLKINHLNDTPSTKAAGAGFSVVCFSKDVKVPVKVRRTLSSVGTSSSNKYSGLYDDEVWGCVECYLNLPRTPHPDQSLLNYAHICELQQQDEQLFALQVKYPDNYVNYNVNGIICSKKDSTQPNWRITLPKSLVVDTIK